MLIWRSCEGILVQLATVTDICNHAVAAGSRTLNLDRHSIANKVMLLKMLHKVSGIPTEMVG